MNEKIEINASWELYYDPSNELAYVQIRIFNSIDKVIWSSPEYNEIGFFNDNWSVDINELNISYINYTNTIYIKLISYYRIIGTPHDNIGYLKTVQVEIMKRTPFCQLIGFKDKIKFSENLTFNVEFFDPLLENNSYLSDQLVLFSISSNHSIIYQNNFTTNQFGTFQISISSPIHLILGENNLIFELKDNKIYNDTIYLYELFVERNPVLVDVITFEENLKKNENLTITLFYYYFRNNDLEPLRREDIELKILNDQDLAYASIYKTDSSGVLSIMISQDSFNVDGDNMNLRLDLIFNGTDSLKNKTFSLHLIISNTEINNGVHINFLLIFAISIPLSLISISLLYKFKKNKNKLLTEITIRY
jgi:hypothetical protein